MPVEVILPKVGLTMTEGTIIEWKKNEGDEVNKGETLFIFETEKVTYEVPSPITGILGKILVKEGETVPVGTVVGYIYDSSEVGKEIQVLPKEVKNVASFSEKTGTTNVDFKEKNPPKEFRKTSEIGEERVKATPLARKIARLHGIELSQIRGTGPHGRITAADVEKFIQTRKEGYGEIPEKTEKEIEEEIRPLSGMRRVIAQKMMSAKIETAQTYMSQTVDTENLLELREILLPYIQNNFGIEVTLTDILMRVVTAAVLKHPVMNTRWTDQGILWVKRGHRGFAVSVEDGLLVPVIRNIDTLSLGEIAKKRSDLVERARTGKITPDEIKGSTFTISNLGMYGVEWFTANLNVPESAILAVGAIRKQPVARGEEIIVRPVMTITLTYDHRVIDGAEAARFMGTLKSFIEHPMLILA